MPKYLLLLIIFLSFSISAGKKKDPIKIDPSIYHFDSICAPIGKNKIFVVSIDDTSASRSQNGIIGETRIGRNKVAKIVCDPIPASVLRKSFQAFLDNNTCASKIVEESTLSLSITILDFSIIETSKKFTQTMDANIVLSITLTETKSGATIKQFTVKAHNSYTTIDTSKHAFSVMQGALKDILKEIANNISG